LSALQNQLICKIERAKHDKEKLAIDLEREEECLTNSLQRQLSASKNEKEKTATEVVELKKQVEKMRSEQEQVRLSFHILISNRHQDSQSTRFYTDISHRKQIARKVEAEQELFSNNLFKKLQKSLQEKTELENQLSRSISARNSLSSSMNSSITGLPDSPVTTKERSMSTEVSTPPIKKTSDPAFVSPKRKISVSGASAPLLSTSPHNAYI
jgi:predicted RNase H-like nuclease (RuvC/YqgF family)